MYVKYWIRVYSHNSGQVIAYEQKPFTLPQMRSSLNLSATCLIIQSIGKDATTAYPELKKTL